MLRGLKLIFIPLLSWATQGKKQYRHHILGILLIFTGLCLVAVAEVGDSKVPEQQRKQLGILLCVLGEITNACFYVLEEVYLRGY